jgi:hypothetical protein
VETATFTIQVLDQSIPANHGKIIMKLTSAQTAVLSGKYVYDLQFTPAAGEPLTYMKGTLTVEPDVTR